MDIKQLNEELEKILKEDTNEIIFSSLEELEDYACEQILQKVSEVENA